MRRVLFVDDEADILNSYREAMHKHRDQMDAMFAIGASGALEALKAAPFDVIVSDLQMPGVNGVDLMSKVKESYPGLVRMMLCNTNDSDGVLQALPISHQVLPKPCDPATMANAIERASRLRSLLTDSLRKRVGNIERLPSPPAMYQELMNAMSRNDASNAKIARIIEKDAAMSAKMLQLVNSACFGLPRRVTVLDQAVSYLGMELIRNLALTFHVFAELERTALRSGFSFDAENEHSLLTARVAQRLIPHGRRAKDAFTAGLLHDIGNLVLAVCVPEKFKSVMHLCASTNRAQHEVEAEQLGVTHAEVGAYLLALWGLPFPIVEAVAFHHNPGAALERNIDVPTAVSVANALVNEVIGNPSSLPMDHLETLKLADRVPAWKEIAQEEVLQLNPVG